MALTPRAPSAGPTGGEGVALPAGMTSFYNRKESALLDFVGSMQTYGMRLTTICCVVILDMVKCPHQDEEGEGEAKGAARMED